MKETIEWIDLYSIEFNVNIHRSFSDKQSDITLSENWISDVLDDNPVISSHFVD